MKVTLDDDQNPVCVTIEIGNVIFHVTESGACTGVYVSSDEDLAIVPTARNRVLVRVKQEVQK